MKTEEFKVFRGAADMKGGRVVALRVPNGAKFSRKEIDEYTKFVGIYGAKGLAYIKVNDVSNLSNGEDSGLQSPIVKFLSENALKESSSVLAHKTATSSSSAQTKPKL